MARVSLHASCDPVGQDYAACSRSYITGVWEQPAGELKPALLAKIPEVIKPGL